MQWNRYIYVPRSLGIRTIPESPLRVLEFQYCCAVGIPKLRRSIPELSVRVLRAGTVLEFLKSAV